ncbi:MAG: 23S rRNA (guanosine2251-2'-O)-methyltransferase, partial [Granulosicoccus sp.]
MTKIYVGGLHSVKAALKSSASEIDYLLVQKGRRDTRLKDMRELARKHAIETREVGRGELNDLVSDVQHQGVVAVLRDSSEGVRQDLAEFIAKRKEEQPEKVLLVLILDEVQDPHNLGACLRSADAAGVDAVVVPA